MGNNTSQNQRNIYRAVISVWLILLATLMSWIVVLDLQRAKSLFLEYANLHYQLSNDRVHIFESVLEGFAAMVSVTNDLGRERIRSYAQKMLERYPHIFMFEIVEKVPHNQIKSFTEYLICTYTSFSLCYSLSFFNYKTILFHPCLRELHI